MSANAYYKSAHALVLPGLRPGALELTDLRTGLRHHLDEPLATAWSEWRLAPGLDVSAWPVEERSPGARGTEDFPACGPLDGVTPRVASRNVRGYAETRDLHVLFGTDCLNRNNPLLVLGPYGSLCWNGIRGGLNIGAIRREALRVFGVDQVLGYVQRLAALGFLDRIGGEAAPLAEADCSLTAPVPKEFPAPDVQYRLRHARVPWYCLWELSRRCDLRCRVCYLPEFETEGTPERRTAIADALADAGVLYVALLGGEPLLLPDLVPLVRRLRDRDVFAKVITNGQTLTERRAHELAEARLNQIEISFDGLSSATHDRSRGPGAFERARRAVDIALRAGIPRVGLVWTIHADNAGELDRLPSLMDGLGIWECYLSLFKLAGYAVLHADVSAPDEATVRSIQSAVSRWRHDRPELTISLTADCTCGRTSAVVDPLGNLRVCSFAPLSQGNVLQEGFDAVWRRIGADSIRAGPLGWCRRGDANAAVPGASTVLARTLT